MHYPIHNNKTGKAANEKPTNNHAKLDIKNIHFSHHGKFPVIVISHHSAYLVPRRWTKTCAGWPTAYVYLFRYTGII